MRMDPGATDPRSLTRRRPSVCHPFRTSGSLLTDLTVATNLLSNNMSMRALGPNLEHFGPKLEENKPFEILKKNVSLGRHCLSATFVTNRKVA